MRTASARERELHPSLERLEEVIAHWLLIGKKLMKLMNRSTFARGAASCIAFCTRSAFHAVHWSIAKLEHVEKRLRYRIYSSGGAPSFFLKDMSIHKRSMERYRRGISDVPLE